MLPVPGLQQARILLEAQLSHALKGHVLAEVRSSSEGVLHERIAADSVVGPRTASRTAPDKSG